jgi:hypothetical protein
MEDIDDTPPTQDAVPTEQPLAPTKSVGTFWERLDEVFKMNLQAQQMRDKVESLLEELPTTRNAINKGKSYLFQPERIVLSSNDDILPSNNLAAFTTSDPEYVANVLTSQTFSQFRIRLNRALVGVKSIQLLSAVIPNAIQNIPDNSTYFFYYKLRNIADSQKGAFDLGDAYVQGDIVTYSGSTYVCRLPNAGIIPGFVYWTLTLAAPPLLSNFLGPWDATRLYGAGDVGKVVSYQNGFYTISAQSQGIIPNASYWVSTTLPADTTLPNYWDMSLASLQSVKLLPSTTPPESLPIFAENYNLVNRTYTDYGDLVAALQTCATVPITATIPNDVTFQYNPSLNKIVFVPDVAGNPDSYYIPCGFEDPTIVYTQAAINNLDPFVNWTPGYTLNLRLGFTWNGLAQDPFEVNPYGSITVNSVVYPDGDMTVANVFFAFMRPIDPRYLVAPYSKINWAQNTVTANNYGDLVNTSCVRVYTDVTLGSTQDSNNKTFTDAEGLLSIVPVNTTNLGVGFYQNNFNNELTKIPDIIPEIGIRLVNDQGLPYVLPNSATVLLECAMTYI